jgi:hypothetical protein
MCCLCLLLAAADGDDDLAPSARIVNYWPHTTDFSILIRALIHTPDLSIPIYLSIYLVGRSVGRSAGRLEDASCLFAWCLFVVCLRFSRMETSGAKRGEE